MLYPRSSSLFGAHPGAAADTSRHTSARWGGASLRCGGMAPSDQSSILDLALLLETAGPAAVQLCLLRDPFWKRAKTQGFPLETRQGESSFSGTGFGLTPQFNFIQSWSQQNRKVHSRAGYSESLSIYTLHLPWQDLTEEGDAEDQTKLRFPWCKFDSCTVSFCIML